MGSGRGKTRRASAQTQKAVWQKIPEKERVVLYHGTADSMLQVEGFQPGVCLTSSKELAWYYAERAEEESGDDTGMVIEVEVRRSHLEADKPSLFEPVGYEGKESDEMIDEIEAYEGELDAEASLKLAGTAYCGEAVPPEQIIIVHSEPWMGAW